jgi:hypothetical protein
MIVSIDGIHERLGSSLVSIEAMVDWSLPEKAQLSHQSIGKARRFFTDVYQTYIAHI